MYRMLMAAQTLPDCVLLELERLQIPSSYIHENPHFVGREPPTRPDPSCFMGVAPRRYRRIAVARVRGGNTGALTLATAPE